jgi:hypothetical protein
MRALIVRILAISCLVTATSWAQMQDVQFTVTRQKLDEQKSRQGGAMTVTVKDIVYKVTVQNRTFKTIPELNVKYLVFYEAPQPGSSEVAELSHKGSKIIANLEGNRSSIFETEPFKLSTSQLDGNMLWLDGSPNKSKDRIVGVWFRAYANDKLVGEYINPSTLSKKRDWKE